MTRNKKPPELPDSIRPTLLAEYVGQDHIKGSLQRALDGARARHESLDHALLYGPPGLGKTTLAGILAHELAGPLVPTTSNQLQQAKALVAILRRIEPQTVLFIDEIHSLPLKVEQILYPAMEDGKLPISVGDGAYTRSWELTLPPFTIVGATTHVSKLSDPLRDRFGLIYRLNYYQESELASIAGRSAKVLGASITSDACQSIAARSRGVARIANRFVRRCRDYSATIDIEAVNACMADLGVDRLGLDDIDRAILHTIAERYNGGPVGLVSLAAATGEDEQTIQDVYEPYLMRLDFLNRTLRGRIITELGAAYLATSVNMT